MKDKLPAVLWYASDWLGSNTRATMTHEERDVYLTLLFRSWYENPSGTLPNDQRKLAMMAEVTPDTWERIKDTIMAKFQSDGNGRVFNVRMLKEARNAKARSSAGASGWTEQRRKRQSEHMTKRNPKRET